MQTNLEATLAKLVSIPSFYDDPVACHAIIDFIRHEIEATKFFHITASAPVASNPWFYATTEKTKQPDIVFAAHLDVVPAPTELFTLTKRDGKFYGRGVYDMKNAAACYLELIRQHGDHLRPLNIGFLFTTDEERDGKSIPEVLATGLHPKVVFLPDGGDNWHVEKRAKGLYGVELIAKGKAAHGSRPWEGENALHTLQDALHILRAHYPYKSPSEATLSVNKLQGGEAFNQLADSASAMLDFRSFNPEELANYRRLVAEITKKYNLELREVNSAGPHIFDPESPGAQSFLSALRRFTDDEVNYCDSYGASDARYIAPLGIPCIIMEPTGGGRHANEEWLLADDLLRYYQFLEEWLFPTTTSATIEKAAQIVENQPAA